MQPFIAAAGFSGLKEGYVFKLGAHGLGYYEDRGPYYEGAVPSDLVRLPAEYSASSACTAATEVRTRHAAHPSDCGGPYIRAYAISSLALVGLGGAAGYYLAA